MLFDPSTYPRILHGRQELLVAAIHCGIIYLYKERVFVVLFFRGLMTPVKTFDHEAAKKRIHKQYRNERRERDGHAQLDIHDGPCGIGPNNDAKEKTNATEKQESFRPNGFRVGGIGVVVKLFSQIHGSLSCQQCRNEASPNDRVENNINMHDQVNSPVGQGGTRLFWWSVLSPLFGDHQIGRKFNCLEEETDERSQAQAFNKDMVAQSSSGIIGTYFFSRIRCRRRLQILNFDQRQLQVGVSSAGDVFKAGCGV
jgi:hypothetical protein